MRENGQTRRELEAEVLRLRRQVADLENALSQERQRAAGEQHARWEAILRSICDQAPHMAGILDLNGTIRHANRVACSLTGKEASEVIGHSLWETPWWSHSEDEQDKLRESLRRAAQEAVQFEITHRASDGTLRHIDFTLRPIRDDRGKVSFLMADGRDITGRRIAEEALRAKTEELDRYFTHALDLLCIASTDGYFRRLNKEWEEALGYSIPELEGTRVLDYVHPEDLEATMSALARLGAQEEILNFANRYRAKDGSYRWIEWRSFPAGKLIYAVARDITDRRRADELLRENMARLQTMVSNAPVVLYGVDRRCVFTLSEGKGLAAMGLKPGEVVGRSAFDVYRDRPEILENFRRALTGEAFTVPVHVGPHVYDAYHEPVYGEDGEYAGTLGVLVDVTERRRVEDALRGSEARYRALVESQIDMISRYLPDTTLTFVNDAYCQFYGKTREELIGHSFLSLVAPEFRELVLKETENLVKDPKPIVGEYLNYRQNGEECWIQWVIQGIVDEIGRVVELQAVGRDITRLKQTEEALRQANLVVENSPAVLFRWKAVGGWPVEYVSENVIQFGYTPHELLTGSTPYIALVHPDDRDRVAQEVQQYSASGVDHFQQEYRIVTTGGEVRWVDDRTAIERDAEGRITYYQGIVIDITERKKAEEALRESEERFRSLVETTSDWVWETDSDAVYTYASPKVRDLLGYKPEEVIGKTPFDLMPDDEAKRIGALFQDLVANQRSIERLENTAQHRDGRRVVLETSGEPFFGTDGRLLGYRGIDRDITERKRIEEALEKRIVALTQPLDTSEGIDFEDLFNLSDIQDLQDLYATTFGVAAIITHPDGTPITQPSNFSELCGQIIRKTPEGMANCMHSDAMIGQYNPEGPNIRSCLSAGLCNAGASITVGGRHIANWLIGQVRNEAQDEEEIIGYAREIGADETAFRTAYRKIPIMSQDQFERVAQVIFVLANQISTSAYQNVQQARFIADRKRAEEELRRHRERLEELVLERTRELEKAQEELVQRERLATLGKLTATVSHELRNPLGTLKASLFTIGERLGGKVAGVEKALNRADRSITRCVRIIDELLYFSKVRPVQFSVTDIDAWLDEVLSDQVIPERVELHRNLHSGAAVEMDQEQMRRAVVNITTNAFQAIEPRRDTGGRVEVESLESAGGVEIRVRDNGEGIEDEIRGKIFDPLYSTKNFGVGLGLSIARQIIERHGGSITIEGAPGEGTTFSIWLPAAR